MDSQAFPKFPNNKFAISFQYLKKEVKYEVDFSHADKHQSFLQVDINTFCIKEGDTFIIDRHDQAFSRYLK